MFVIYSSINIKTIMYVKGKDDLDRLFVLQDEDDIKRCTSVGVKHDACRSDCVV